MLGLVSRVGVRRAAKWEQTCVVYGPLKQEPMKQERGTIQLEHARLACQERETLGSFSQASTPTSATNTTHFDHPQDC